MSIEMLADCFGAKETCHNRQSVPAPRNDGSEVSDDIITVAMLFKKHRNHVFSVIARRSKESSPGIKPTRRGNLFIKYKDEYWNTGRLLRRKRNVS